MTDCRPVMPLPSHASVFLKSDVSACESLLLYFLRGDNHADTFPSLLSSVTCLLTKLCESESADLDFYLSA